jgi:hypothetical protein
LPEFVAPLLALATGGSAALTDRGPANGRTASIVAKANSRRSAIREGPRCRKGHRPAIGHNSTENRGIDRADRAKEELVAESGEKVQFNPLS